jgi:hypothetical protein
MFRRSPSSGSHTDVVLVSQAHSAELAHLHCAI